MSATISAIDFIEDPGIPAEDAKIISALAGRSRAHMDQRSMPRHPYRVPVNLRLFTDKQPCPLWKLYTRDLNARGLGFVATRCLPLGHGGVIELPTPDGGTVSMQCTVLRCHQIAPGWYEGCLYFVSKNDEPKSDGPHPAA